MVHVKRSIVFYFVHISVSLHLSVLQFQKGKEHHKIYPRLGQLGTLMLSFWPASVTFANDQQVPLSLQQIKAVVLCVAIPPKDPTPRFPKAWPSGFAPRPLLRKACASGLVNRTI